MSNSRRALAGAAAAALILAAAPSAAQAAGQPKVETSYSQCDGYGGPSGSGDGMTSQALTLLIFVPDPGKGDTTRTRTSIGVHAISECDAALADVPAKYWQRKVSLLRARATHQLAAGDVDGALAGLERAEAAVVDPADPYFARSLGLGISYLRAYALREKGEQAKAEALAVETWAKRPYNRQSAISALIAMGPRADAARTEPLVQTLARLAPGGSGEIADRAFDAGRYQEVVDLFPTLAAPVEVGDEPMTREQRANLELENRDKGGVYRAYRGGQAAYALAALGKPAEARAMVAAARQQLMTATDPVPLAPDAPKWRKALQLTHLEMNERALVQGTKLLDAWNSLIERRIKVAEGKAEEVLDTLNTDRLPRDRASAELVDALMAKLPAAHPAQAPLKGLRADVEPKPEDRFPEGLKDLFDTLPDAESRKRMSRYDRQGLFSGDTFTVSTVKETGVTRVEFLAMDGSPAIVEEMALLRAADMALKAGKPGLIVLGRKDYKHTTNNTMYGTVMASYHSGFETRLEVVFVDPAALPPEFAGAGWRVIDAKAVRDALLPVYSPAPAGGKAG